MYAGSCYMQVNLICGLHNMGAVDQTDKSTEIMILEIILTFLACQIECDNF